VRVAFAIVGRQGRQGRQEKFVTVTTDDPAERPVASLLGVARHSRTRRHLTRRPF
jgi:hypothetical protein